MATFWELLSEPGREKWAEIYKQLTGREWVPPEKDKHGIHLEGKIEDTAEIAKIMEERPNYSLDVQGREG